MALAFTDAQCGEIRARLLESARRHAITCGVRKTSLDALTADAGISKSSFYKFYASKELLFLEIVVQWRMYIIQQGMQCLTASVSTSSKERASAFVFRIFECVHQLGIIRFLQEDLPYLQECVPPSYVHTHCLNTSHDILNLLKQAHIQFTAPDSTVLSAIQLLFLSILNLSEVEDAHAFQILVKGACDQLVA